MVLGGPDGLIEGQSLAEVMTCLTRTLEAIGAIVDPRFDIEVGIPDIIIGSVKLRVVLRKNFKGFAVGVTATLSPF